MDTLIAYDMYLTNVLTFLEMAKMKEGRNFSILKDFDYAMSKSALYAINHAGTISSGFYNLKCPVTIMRDEKKLPVAERTLVKKDFDKKYSETDFDSLLMEYLDEKYHVYGDRKQVQENNSSQDSAEYDSFEFKGMKFYCLSKKLYLDSNMSPIKYIEAISEDGKINLKEYFDFSMQIYSGDIYDTEGNYLHSTLDNREDLFEDNIKE